MLNKLHRKSGRPSLWGYDFPMCPIVCAFFCIVIQHHGMVIENYEICFLKGVYGLLPACVCDTISINGSHNH